MITLSGIGPISAVMPVYRISAKDISRMVLDHLTDEHPLPRGMVYDLLWDGLSATISIRVDKIGTTSDIPKGTPQSLTFNTEQPEFVPSSMVPDDSSVDDF